MRARRRGALLCAVLLVALPAAAQEPAPAPRAELSVQPLEATVGDPLDVTLTLDLPPGTRLAPPEIGPQIGPFSVIDGAWSGPQALAGGERWIWSGSVCAFRTGALELPPVRLTITATDGKTIAVQTPARSVTIRSVLDPQQDAGDPALADLKPPASIAPDYRALLLAASILVLLLLGSAALWWLHRRYAARLAAVPPADPFQRTPPHVWVYGELQKLLDRRLAEQGQVDLFFAELSRIVKLYLSGRYRVELMERTTAELPDRLRQAGAGEKAIQDTCRLLSRCDMVKFAGQLPDPAACREAVEEAYRIVDATRPVPASTEGAPVRGAA